MVFDLRPERTIEGTNFMLALLQHYLDIANAKAVLTYMLLF